MNLEEITLLLFRTEQLCIQSETYLAPLKVLDVKPKNLVKESLKNQIKVDAGSDILDGPGVHLDF